MNLDNDRNTRMKYKEVLQQTILHLIIKLGSGSRVPVTAFRLMAGLKPLNTSISVLDLSFCKLDKLAAADPSMKVYKYQIYGGIWEKNFANYLYNLFS